MNVVIGSGPAGVAAATALLERGEQVTVLDAGGTLEPNVESVVDKLSTELPERWDPRDVEQLRGELRPSPEGAPLKLPFGSDYPYRGIDAFMPVLTDGVDAYRAFAEGGLSVLWGASILPYTDRELRGWPLRAAELRPHYQAALRLTGLSGESDPLEAIYPLLVAPSANLPPSKQALRLLQQMTMRRSELESKGIFFGKARLAISEPRGAALECVQCGLCLYGCPYGFIYSSRSTLHRLLNAYPHLRHLPGFVVRKLTEQAGQVVIEAVSRDSGKPASFRASRVYLAAGVYASTAILLASLGARGVPVRLQQSDHFLLLLLAERERGVSSERLHSLSQIFLEIIDESVSEHTIHLQIYTYNDLYSRMVRKRLGPAHWMAGVFDPLVERLVLIKGYLHSDDSSGIEATLEPDGDPVLRLRALRNEQAATTIRAVLEVLRRNKKAIGASPLRFALRIGRPGSGAHVGGSFPMDDSPREFASDRLGRPRWLSRVHVVDSSVFTSLPAPTITLSVMANAHRIASESAVDRT